MLRQFYYYGGLGQREQDRTKSGTKFVDMRCRQFVKNFQAASMNIHYWQYMILV